ncbi:lasso peptide biosynthesis B2 protein [Streptomyces klenkii]
MPAADPTPPEPEPPLSRGAAEAARALLGAAAEDARPLAGSRGRHEAVAPAQTAGRCSRTAVTGTSARCAGPYCVLRSLATALLRRLRGTWPTWCTGVRTGPFAAHAWVEAEGRPVGEPAGSGCFSILPSVPPRERER